MSDSKEDQRFMHIITCPQCKSAVKLWPRNFKQWRTEQRKCPQCGVWLRLSNPLLIGGLSGLLFGGFIVSSRYWGFPNEWLMFATLIPICWLLGIIIIKTLGRWEALPEGFKESPKVQFWSRVLSISSWLAAVAMAVTVINMGLMTRKLIMTLQSTSYDPEIGQQAFQHWQVSFKLNAVVGYGICAIALIGCIVASFMRRRARRFDQLSTSSD